ncbi:ATP-dependent DNA helicase RecG [Leifsonia xyli subsp. xyli]|uniref:Probable DNA 3'-5' helicase RecG n=2 Tax=Leifsonia xyli subsp. xyli TaxID=59736 RepID=Q6AFJ8_LEIXX|nr:ATP-dependent DNA helicase RecG [Leifsonia xyli]AAT88847.1 ATP-dependent DNA helicase RecG [Leifsonia xyli subsp. xyli str. CTCB07]ODA90207.1 ATP-dependent DNA helicase RecG [Leifsonia xyli subsp. xyli]
MTSVPAPAAGVVSLDAKLTGVLGGRTAAAFEKAFGTRTVADLLSHYPRRYARRGELTALANLPLDENVTIIAEVLRVQERSMRARRGSILEVKISDGEGILTLTFFNQSWRAKDLTPGARGIFAGKVSAYRGALQLAHPDYELFEPDAGNTVDSGSATAKEWAQTPIPIYPATGAVASWQVQKAVGLALDALGRIEDPVPAGIVAERGLISFRDALEGVHRPQKDSQWQRARDALRFQEAFVLQAALLQQRAAARAVAATPRRAVPGGLLERFDAGLPFALTDDQALVGGEIARDLDADAAMHRLVQGEVGSGKTLVALRAMLAVADSGGQSALLAPTEVLAAQHLRSIAAMLGPGLSIELMPTLLTGQLSAAERKRALLRTVSGQSRLVVGTHALLGDAVTFYDLGLVVVDEQHRFGVEQREELRAKGGTPPHVLVLTATPIPRTVAMTVFGDLDVSTIAHLPAGRQVIESFVVPLVDRPGWERRIWERASEEIAKGRQVFVVCPAITGKETEEDTGQPEQETEAAFSPDAPARPIANVESVAAQVRADLLFASARIGVLHGGLPSEAKDETMRSFAVGDIDLLIATTVIEVGVDVPNASVMIVLDADRFGVSQLHQLRGRVGRGGVPGLCLLVTAAGQDTLARERVEAVAATLDGFELANIDLELRREGDVLGSRQSGGRSSLRLLRVASDGELIAEARVAAEETLSAPDGLAAQPALAAALARRLDETERAFLGKS